MKIEDYMIKKIPMSCLLKLQAVYDSLKSAEKKAADFLLENSDFLISATISEAADRAGCSAPTFVRISHRMGLDGFSSLKEELRKMAYTTEAPKRDYSEISISDDSVKVTRKVFDSVIQALNDTMNLVDKDAYDQAIDALMNAKKVLFIGVGDAYSVASSGTQKLMRIGKMATATCDSDAMIIHASHLNDGDVVVAISHSGKSKGVVDVAKYLKDTNVKVIAITNFSVSPLAKNSDIILLTSTFIKHLNGEIVAKRVVQMSILESLFVNMIMRDSENVKALDKSNYAVEINKI